MQGSLKENFPLSLFSNATYNQLILEKMNRQSIQRAS
jgi:hypothetical protein